MEFSDDLKLFLRQLHVDFFRETDAVNAITEILAGLGSTRIIELGRFLDRLLSSPYEISELDRQWRQSGSDMALADAKQIPSFLGMIRDISRSLAATSSRY